LAIALPTLIAAALTVYQLPSRSLWLDEGASIAIASQHGSALWHAIRHDGGNMLVYYLLLHLLIGWFGSGEWVVRLPSAVADAATAGLTAAVAWQLLGRRWVALGAGLLTAVSLPLVFWGQDARGYALMVALATASMLAFTRIVQSRGPVPRLAALAYLLLTLLSLYVSFYAGLIVLAQLVLLPVLRTRVRLILGALAVVALACIPLAVLALQRGSGQLFWVDPVTPAIAAKAGAVLISSGFPPNFHITSRTILASAVTIAVGLGLLVRLTVVTIRSLGGARSDRPRPIAAWIAGSWLLVPVVVVLAAAVAGEPVELARCVILLIPTVGLLLAWGLDLPGRARILGLSAVVLLVVIRALVLVPTYRVTPENWKAAVSHVAQASQPGDCILFYPQDGRMMFDYYRRHDPAIGRLNAVLPTAPWRIIRPYVEEYATPSATGLNRIEHDCSRLWVVASHQGHRPGPVQSERDLSRYEALLTTLHRAYRRRQHRTFGYAAPIYVTLFRR
jgi:mannosyltransferase